MKSMHPAIKEAHEELTMRELESGITIYDSDEDDFDFIDHKIHNNLQTNYLSETNEYHFLKLELQRLENYREETLQDLNLKYNLTIRKLQQLQQSRSIDSKHQKFLSNKIQNQFEVETKKKQTLLQNKQQNALLKLKNVKDEIKELQEKMRESEKSHVARKLKLQNAILDIEDQLKELDEKESTAKEAKNQILTERHCLLKKLDQKLYELKLAKERLAHAKQDLEGTSTEVSEFNA